MICEFNFNLVKIIILNLGFFFNDKEGKEEREFGSKIVKGIVYIKLKKIMNCLW